MLFRCVLLLQLSQSSDGDNYRQEIVLMIFFFFKEMLRALDLKNSKNVYHV